ncbi:MAG: hypothetical protein J6O51_04405 [Bacteroidales bacterium]|nr:hypothetical protein [Bacteroidales bacterium]
MRRFVFFALSILMAVGCQGLTGVDESKREWKVDGNTMTWGDHEYTIRGSIPELEYDKNGVLISAVPTEPTGWVSFTANPAGYNEFSTVYTQFLGKSPMGAAAMIPMAMEIYGRNRMTGERCIKLLCGSVANADAVTRELYSKMYRSSYSPTEDQYYQRYLPAALLKGARADNSYTPDEPYTVQMMPSPNRSTGDFSYLFIYAEGWDTKQRSVEIKAKDNLYIVSNCPSCYSQCKVIKGEWGGIK